MLVASLFAHATIPELHVNDKAGKSCKIGEGGNMYVQKIIMTKLIPIASYDKVLL